MAKKQALRLLNDRFPFFFRLEVKDHSYVMALLDENSNEVDAEYFDEGSLRMMWNDPGGGPPVTYPFNGLIEYLHRRPRPWMDYLREKRGGGKSEMYYVGLFRKMWTDKVDEWLETARRRIDAKTPDEKDEEERRLLAEILGADLTNFTDLNAKRNEEEK